MDEWVEALRSGTTTLDFKFLRGKRTQVEVGVAAGVQQGELSKLERYGPRAVSVPVLKRVLRYYEVHTCSPSG